MSLLSTVFTLTVRDQVERAAYMRLWGKIDEERVPALLYVMRKLGKIQLEGDEAAERFADLVLAIADRDSGDKAAEERVEAALTALVGETP